MPNKKIKVAVMIGSIRKERQSIKPANVIIEMLKERGVEPIVLDLQEMNLPMFDDGLENESKTKLLDVYKEMDGMIIISPEYNHSISSPLKNAIDYAREKELFGKPMSCVGVSGGPWGGARMVGELRHIWLGVGGLSLPVAAQTPNVGDFKEENPPEIWLKGVNSFLDNSLKWFNIIKLGSETIE